jgi:hypothetical protein
MEQVSAAGRYAALETTRSPYLERARDCAKLTIPSLYPPQGSNGSTKLETPFQGLGARGVNNLSAKLLLALLPPNSPFFRLAVDDYTLEDLTQQEGLRAEVEKALGKIERTAMSEIESQAYRVTVGEALKHLIVAGNGLLYVQPEGGLKFFSLENYVVRRDPSGNVLEIVVKESVAFSTLPAKLQQELLEVDTNEPKKLDTNKNLDLFTRVVRDGRKWVVYQEVKGRVIEGTRGTYPLDKSPWIPLRFTKIDGEDYGRGYVEEYYGDLRSLEALTKAIVEGSAAAAKVLFLVNPNGLTSQKTLSEAPNGAVRAGNAEDISVLQVEKYADFRVAFETIESISQRLSFAFLLNTSVQRSGERVTAEEIRYMAGELEDALGGVYSVLSQEFQLPLIQRLLYQLERKKRIPKLPEGTVRPTITTGLEALGRGHDLNKLDVFIGGVLQTFGPEVVSQYLNVGDYLTRRGTALGIDMAGLVRSEEEVMQMRQAQMKQAQEAAMGQMMAQGGMDMAKEAVKAGVNSG